MTELVLLYIPVPDQECGLSLARELVGAKLAACANLLAPGTSVYEWEGTLCESTEQFLLLKTTPEHADACQQQVLNSHPYNCPCVLRLPAHANPAFGEWVSEQLR